MFEPLNAWALVLRTDPAKSALVVSVIGNMHLHAKSADRKCFS